MIIHYFPIVNFILYVLKEWQRFRRRCSNSPRFGGYKSLNTEAGGWGWGWRFFLTGQTRPDAHAFSYTMGTGSKVAGGVALTIHRF
jgi:hypothetical protein